MGKQKHSRSYHRYFENYAEKSVAKPGGGYKIERVYVGRYYTVDLPDDSLRRQRAAILVLFLLCLGGYLIGGLSSKVSAVSVVAIATMPPLLVFIWLAMAVFYRLTAPREMEIRAYRDSSEQLIRSARMMAAAMTLCFVVTLGGSVWMDSYSSLESLPTLACYLVCLGSACAIWRAEKATPYKIIAPKHERPAESSPIRYEMPDE